MLSALLVFGLAALLRFVLAGERGLWADELFSLAMATGHSLEHPAAVADSTQGDFVEHREAQAPAAYNRYLQHDHPPAGPRRVVRAVLLSDTSPPLYYLLLNLWTRGVGTSDRSLRLFSVFWALAAFPLIWSLGARIGGPPAAIAAGLLYALAPVSLYYAVEGRMYSMLWFLATAFVGLTFRLHDRGNDPATICLWVIAAAAGFLTHYFFAFVWSAAVFWLALHPGRFKRPYLAAAVAVTIAAVLPWYLQVPSSLSRWRVTGSWLNGRLSFTQALSAPLLLGWNLLAGRGVWGGSRWMDRLLAALLVVLAWAVWRRGIRPIFSPPLRLLWLWVLAACFGPLVFDLLRGTMASLIGRYALAGIPAAMLLVGFALSLLPVRQHLLLLVLIVLTWSPGIRGMFEHPRHWEPYLGIAEVVSADARPGDLVIVHSIPSGVLGVARYMTAEVPIASWVGQLQQRQVPRDLQTLLPGYRRIIFVRVHAVAEPSPEENWLRENATLLSRRRIQSTDLLYFAPKDGTTFAATAAASARR
jgi:uncharacterized membrane protein